MTVLHVPMLSAALLFCCLVATAAAASSAGERERVRNGDFSLGEDGKCPRHWTPWSPVWKPAACRIRKVPDGLLVDGPERPYAVGGVVQAVKSFAAKRAYAVDVTCRPTGIPSARQSILVRLTWTKAGRVLHPAGRLVREKGVRNLFSKTEGEKKVPGAVSQGDLRFHDVFVVPRGADGARLSLEVKWPHGGSVLWRKASIRPTSTPTPRTARIGSVFLRPKNSTPAENLRLWCKKIDEAGTLQLDAVCLGEAIRVVGTGKTVADVAEPIPGPATRSLCAAAKRNRLWVVAGLTEREGETAYNTAVLIDRSGKLAGTYRKVHLPREEWKKGVTPGGAYPVFETDFGTVAVMICYDWFFPEAASIFALNGAEVLFAPTWGNTLPDAAGRAEGETVFRVRARDNGLFLVPSVYDGSSMVIDPLGRILATSKGANEGVFWAEIDLSKRDRLWWVGDWRAIGPRHRMPGTYGKLTERPRP